MRMGWIRDDSQREKWKLTIPGRLRISAAAETYGESIVGSITVAGCVVKKWAVPRDRGGVVSVCADIEDMLGGAAEMILRSGRKEEQDA